MVDFTEYRSLIDGSIQRAIPDSGDLQAHYIAADQPESDGQTVDPFVDQEGADDAAATGDPTLQAGALNGEDVVRYDTNDHHSVTGTIVSQPLHVMFVGQLNTTSTGSFQEFIDGGNDTDRCLIQYRNSDGAWVMFGGNQIVGGSGDTNPHVFNAYFDGANSYLRVDGTEVVSGDAGTNSLSLVSLGARTDGSDSLSGDIPEVPIHASALSSSAESDWEQYLADRYGITLA